MDEKNPCWQLLTFAEMGEGECPSDQSPRQDKVPHGPSWSSAAANFMKILNQLCLGAELANTHALKGAGLFLPQELHSTRVEAGSMLTDCHLFH